MKNRDSLFQLIKSLTKNEKGYFKKHVSGMAGKNANAYLKLFDVFSKQKVYDDSEIKKQLGTTILRKQNLAVTKHYLYEVIMKSLRAYYGKPSVDSMLKEMIRNAEILFYLKDRKEDAREILHKALSIAAKYERFLVELEIYNFLYTIDSSLHEDTLDYGKAIAEAHKKQMSILDQYRNYIELRTLFSRQRVVFDAPADQLQKEYMELRSMLKNPLLKNNIPLSYKAGLYYYSTMANIYANGLYEAEKSYELNKELIAFMESDTAKLNEDLSHYAIALNNLMADQMHLELYDEMKETHEKIKHKYSSYEFEFIKLNALGAAAATELTYCALTHQIAEGLAIIKNMEKDIIPHERKINRNCKIELTLGISVIYLLAQDYAKARFWLNKNLTDSSPERKDIKAFSQILNLIATYELKDYDYLEHLVSACKRNFKINGTYFNFEKPILDFMNKAMIVPPEEKVHAYLLQLKTVLENKMDNREKSMYCYFNIPLWVKSKIEKTK